MRTKSNRYAALLAGGAGKRFWPWSRAELPKQLLALNGRHPMLIETLRRLGPLVPRKRTLVITTSRLADCVRRTLAGCPTVKIAAEPVGRNTAAACGYGCLLARFEDPDAVVGIFPADAFVRPVGRFRRTVARAFEVAADTGDIVLIGITPTFPSTAYGYLRRGSQTGRLRGTPVYQVSRFKEKPRPPLAARYFKNGGYLWNSGMFVARAEVMLEAICRHIPELAGGLDRIARALGTPRQDEVLKAVYPRLPSVSLDYGVLEKSRGVSMLEADFEWDDMGSWLALERVGHRDARGNLVLGTHLGLDTRDVIVVSDNDHMIATVGVGDLIVVHTENATLVASKRHSQRVGELVELMKREQFARFR